MKAKEVLKLLQITRVTLWRYVKDGRIRGEKINNRYIYNDDDVYALIGIKKEKKDKINVSYSRVSTQSQKDQLKEQTRRIYESCISRNVALDEQIEDIKSGMDGSRKGFNALLRKVIQGDVELVIIENKDRLVRFGFDVLETIFKYFGTKILVLNDALDNRSYEQELTEDLISIIHYFTMKSYSHRRKLNKMRKMLEEAENEIEDAKEDDQAAD
jgi:predicted site-specific integrase-resolvase